MFNQVITVIQNQLHHLETHSFRSQKSNLLKLSKLKFGHSEKAESLKQCPARFDVQGQTFMFQFPLTDKRVVLEFKNKEILGTTTSFYEMLTEHPLLDD